MAFVKRRNRRHQGGQEFALRDEGETPMKGRFWAIPGIAAMLGALALASTAEGVLSAREATLPRAVQLALPGSPPHPSAAGLRRTGPTGQAHVVPASRPVVAQLSPSDPAAVTSAPGTRPAVAAHGSSQSNVAGESEGSSGDAASSADGSPLTVPTDDGSRTTTTLGSTPNTTTTITTTTIIPPTTTTTTTTIIPPTTTTTTTRRSGEGGDE
jgi:hypothetical protein